MKIFIASTIAFIGYVFGQTTTTEHSEQGLGAADNPNITGEAHADEPKPVKVNPAKKCPPGAKGCVPEKQAV